MIFKIQLIQPPHFPRTANSSEVMEEDNGRVGKGRKGMCGREVFKTLDFVTVNARTFLMSVVPGHGFMSTQQ